MTQESSVLFALKELHALEESRQTDERAARRVEEERVRLAAEAKATVERDARLRIEAEAKARVDVEARTRDVDADRRLAALRAELAAVQSERERLRHAAVSTVIEPSSSSRAWPWAFAVVTSAAVALVVALVVSPATPPVVVAPELSAPVPVVQAALEPAAVVAPPAVVAPVVVAEPPHVRPPPRGSLNHCGPHRHCGVRTPPPDINFGTCPENDPTCGLDD